MFQKDKIKGYITGAITYLVVLVILELFGVNTTIVNRIIFIIMLIIYFIIQITEKK